MSQIDQAFINAYSESGVGQGSPATLQMPTPPRHESAPPSVLKMLNRQAAGVSQSVRFDRQEAKTSPSPALLAEPAVQASNLGARMDQGADYQEVELTLPPLGRERRPLSAFAAPPQPPASVFQPAFEVDGFTWPTVVNQLVTESRRLFQPVLDMLQANTRSGRSLVGLAGASNRVGCTTVTLCLARLLAEAGLRTAVVDANFTNGQLAAQLGVEFEQGWDMALAGNIPLAECAVHSLHDAIVLIPLAGPAPEARNRLSSLQTSVLAGMLRYHYDVVLFDLGTATDSAQAGAMATLVEHCRLDAGIQIARSGAQDAATTQALNHLMQLFGANSLGTIGNRAA